MDEATALYILEKWDIVGVEMMPLDVLRECYEYRSKRLDQQTAKVQELRERLRGIEWDLKGFGGFVCPACHIGGDTPVPIPHAPDCWLKAEIDQLEDGGDE